MVVPRYEKPFHTHKFGSLGGTLKTAAKSEFFRWFHLVEAEREAVEGCGPLIRFRPEGDPFRALCFLDALSSSAGELVCLQLALHRDFVDGRDWLFAQDMAKSFLREALPDACQSVLADFMAEMTAFVPIRGQTPGGLVYCGIRDRWQAETGWSRLLLSNGCAKGWLWIEVRPNPAAPNAKLVSEDVLKPWWKRIW